MIRSDLCRVLVAVGLAVSLLFAPAVGGAADQQEEQSGTRVIQPYTPSRTAKAVDLLFARPLAFVFAVAGGTLFVATSPVLYPTGNLTEARERFVDAPSAMLRGPLGG